MDFGTNKTPIEIIKEGNFGDTYLRDIYSGLNARFYKSSSAEFKELKSIDKKYYCSDYYDVNVNVKCGTLLRFWENKGWINEIDPFGWFQWYLRYYLGRTSGDDKRQIKGWKGVVNRFKGILIKMIKDADSKLMIILFHLRLDMVMFKYHVIKRREKKEKRKFKEQIL